MQAVSRLLDHFVPSHYTLSLDIDRKARTFHGTVTITGESLGDAIAVHAHELTIDTVHVDTKPAEFELGKDDEN